jgi:hypothetical protein
MDAPNRLLRDLERSGQFFTFVGASAIGRLAPWPVSYAKLFNLQHGRARLRKAI